MPRHVHEAMHASQKKPPFKVIYRSGMVTDHEAMKAGIRKFVGVAMTHAHDEKCAGKDSKHSGTREACTDACNYGRFLTTDLVVELPDTRHSRKEYCMAICEGHLAAVDESTARRAGEVGRIANWQTLMATQDELDLAKSTAEESDKADKATLAAVVKARVAQTPANPDPEAKLGGKFVSPAPAPSPESPKA